jgi:hypothetical protein
MAFKITNHLKKNSNKEINEVKKSIKDLGDKFSNLNEKLSKDIELLKERKKQTKQQKAPERLETKCSIKQISTPGRKSNTKE